MRVSIVILVKDEEKDLPGCLESITWCDDIHVVDSGSTDSTRDVALGSQWYENTFRGFGEQRNWALANCNLKHPWVLFLDADERSTEAFRKALDTSIESADDSTAGFYCCSKTMLFDTWLKRSDSFPKWQFRIVRKDYSEFENFGHGQREVLLKGELGYLREPYLHFAFSKGWSQWIERHNKYSTQEAQLRVSRKLVWKELLSKHRAVRLKSLRVLVSRMPAWPIARFLISYLFKLGFLEGRAGLVYSVNMAIYEYLIMLKMAELRSKSLDDSIGK